MVSKSEDTVTVVSEEGYTYTRKLPKQACCHGNRVCPLSECSHGDHLCLELIRCDHDDWSPRKPEPASRKEPSCTCMSSLTAAPSMANQAIRALCPVCTPALMLARPLHEPHQFSDVEDEAKTEAKSQGDCSR